MPRLEMENTAELVGRRELRQEFFILFTHAVAYVRFRPKTDLQNRKFGILSSILPFVFSLRNLAVLSARNLSGDRILRISGEVATGST
jgi:hypothetical protein